MRILTLVIALVLVVATIACAGISAEIPQIVKQPDGTEITIITRGDEYRSWDELPNGYSVIENPASGMWEYAVHDGEENLVPSGIGVYPDQPPPADIKPHLMPKDNVEERRKAEESRRKHLKEFQEEMERNKDKEPSEEVKESSRIRRKIVEEQIRQLREKQKGQKFEDVTSLQQ